MSAQEIIEQTLAADDDLQGFVAPILAQRILDDLTATGYVVVCLPGSSESLNGAARWNDFPFVHLAPARDDPISVGATCEHLYWINPTEARNVAAALLAAAHAAEVAVG